VEIHYDYSPKASQLNNGMFQGFLFDVLPDEEELKQINFKGCKTF
jgi:hypothetical protein